MVSLLFSPLMPQASLHRKLLQELDDINLSYKWAHLSSYLDDICSLTSSEEANTSGASVSSISSITSASTLSSHSSGSGSNTSISLMASERMEDYYIAIEKEIQKVRDWITNVQVLCPKHKVPKHS